jgi:hypothetical protein
MTPPRLGNHYRCRYCGVVLPAWFPVPGEVNGAMLLHHLSRRHPDRAKYYLDQMRHEEDIGEVVEQAYAVVEEPPQTG